MTYFTALFAPLFGRFSAFSPLALFSPLFRNFRRDYLLGAKVSYNKCLEKVSLLTSLVNWQQRWEGELKSFEFSSRAELFLKKLSSKSRAELFPAPAPNLELELKTVSVSSRARAELFSSSALRARAKLFPAQPFELEPSFFQLSYKSRAFLGSASNLELFPAQL